MSVSAKPTLLVIISRFFRRLVMGVVSMKLFAVSAKPTLLIISRHFPTLGIGCGIIEANVSVSAKPTLLVIISRYFPTFGLGGGIIEAKMSVSAKPTLLVIISRYYIKIFPSFGIGVVSKKLNVSFCLTCILGACIKIVSDVFVLGCGIKEAKCQFLPVLHFKL